MIPGYQLHRLDRNRHGGGVLMYALEEFCVSPICHTNNNLEFLPLSVKILNQYFCIAIFYRPPSSSSDIFDLLFYSIVSINISRFLILDFNVISTTQITVSSVV